VKVDLPIPGSPPRSVTEPGTMPPPRHRSASAIPVGTVVAAPDSNSVIGCTAPSCATAASDALVSTRAFQAEHEVQRPTHFAWVAAHDPQVYGWVRVAVRVGMGRTLRTRCDRSRSSGLPGPEQVGETVDHRVAEVGRHQGRATQQHR
jgi:hypothetical protein